MRCIYCGESVDRIRVRDHLEEHSPQTHNWDYEDVLSLFVEAKEEESEEDVRDSV